MAKVLSEMTEEITAMKAQITQMQECSWDDDDTRKQNDRFKSKVQNWTTHSKYYYKKSVCFQ